MRRDERGRAEGDDVERERAELRRARAVVAHERHGEHERGERDEVEQNVLPADRVERLVRPEDLGHDLAGGGEGARTAGRRKGRSGEPRRNICIYICRRRRRAEKLRQRVAKKKKQKQKQKQKQKKKT